MPEVLIDRGHFDSVGDYQNPDELYDELLECALLSTDLDLRMQSIRTRLDDTGLYASPHFV